MCCSFFDLSCGIENIASCSLGGSPIVTLVACIAVTSREQIHMSPPINRLNQAISVSRPSCATIFFCGAQGADFGSSTVLPSQTEVPPESSSASNWGSGFAAFATPLSSAPSMIQKSQQFTPLSTNSFGQLPNAPQSIFGSSAIGTGSGVFGNQTSSTTSNIFGTPSSGFGQPFGLSGSTPSTNAFDPPKLSSSTGSFRVPNKMD